MENRGKSHQNSESVIQPVSCSSEEVCSSVEQEHKPKECESNHSHNSEHYHSHRLLSKNRLRTVILLTGIMMAAEFVGGYFTNSIALMSDAGHMLTHFGALLISFIAMKIAERGPCDRRTFGLYRVEILAALLNAIVLIGVGALICYDAFSRLLAPPPVREIEMLAVAILGLIVNLASMALLIPHSKGSLNIRSAALHMLGDTLSSVGVVGAGIVMIKWHTYWLDPVAALVIGVVVLIWAVSLVRESVSILLESTPKHIDLEAVSSAVRSVPGVLGIHDIHVWEITSRMYMMSAHVKINDIKLSESDAILAKICNMLNERFDITHTSIQFER